MPKNPDEIIGQYATDKDMYPGDPGLLDDSWGVKSMRGDGNPALHHAETLFDEADGVLDETTGRQNMRTADDGYDGEGIVIVPKIHRTNRIAKNAADLWMKGQGHKW